MRTYKVKQGDTLESIAGQLGCGWSAYDILRANAHVPKVSLNGQVGFDPDFFYEGQTLLLPEDALWGGPVPGNRPPCGSLSAPDGSLGAGVTVPRSVGPKAPGSTYDMIRRRGVGTDCNVGMAIPVKAGLRFRVPKAPGSTYRAIPENMVSQWFGLIDPRLSELHRANRGDPGGFVQTLEGCMFRDWQPGKLIYIPDGWPDPVDPNDPSILWETYSQSNSLINEYGPIPTRRNVVGVHGPDRSYDEQCVAAVFGWIGSAVSSGEGGEGGEGGEEITVGVPGAEGVITPGAGKKVGDKCATPASIPIKPWLRYVIPSGVMPGYVSQEFKMTQPRLGELNSANSDEPNGFVWNGSVCVMARWVPGQEIKIPANWGDPDPNNPHIKILPGVGIGSTGEEESGFPFGLALVLGAGAGVLGLLGVGHLLRKRRASK